MSLFTRLGEKSWENPGSWHADPETYRPAAAKVLLILYFGVAAVLFTLVTSAYLMRMGLPVMAHGPMGNWRPLPEPPLLWINTGILFLASLAWEGARGTRQGAGRSGGASRPACWASCSWPANCCCGTASWRPAMGYAATRPPPSSI